MLHIHRLDLNSNFNWAFCRYSVHI